MGMDELWTRSDGHGATDTDDDMMGTQDRRSEMDK